MNEKQGGHIEEFERKYYARFDVYTEENAKRKRNKKCIFICPVKGEGSMTKLEREASKAEIMGGFGLVQGEMSPDVKASITFGNAAQSYLESAQRRKRKPLKPALPQGQSLSGSVP